MSMQVESKQCVQAQSIWLKMTLLFFLHLAGAQPLRQTFDHPNELVFTTDTIKNPPASSIRYKYPLVHLEQLENLKDYYIMPEVDTIEAPLSSSSTWKIKRLQPTPLKKKPENEEIPTQSDNANSLKYRGTIADLEEALINLHHIPPPAKPSNPAASQLSE